MLGVHIHAFVYACSFTVSNVMVMVRLVISLFMSLKRGTSKTSEKVPYYFLCQQQNICILNCTDISLQILGCACSFSVPHGMLHIWAAEMPHSCIPELLPGHWPQCRGPPLPLFSLLSFSCVYTDICVFFPIGFSCFVCFFFPFFACFPLFLMQMYMSTF